MFCLEIIKSVNKEAVRLASEGLSIYDAYKNIGIKTACIEISLSALDKPKKEVGKVKSKN